MDRNLISWGYYSNGALGYTIDAKLQPIPGRQVGSYNVIFEKNSSKMKNIAAGDNKGNARDIDIEEVDKKAIEDAKDIAANAGDNEEAEKQGGKAALIPELVKIGLIFFLNSLYRIRMKKLLSFSKSYKNIRY